MRFSRFKTLSLIFPLLAVTALGQVKKADSDGPHQTQPAVLKPAELANLLPAAVFFRGQSAPVQVRNSGGVRFSDNDLTLVALVDTSGYSSQVQEKYQAYLITEKALDIDGHQLPIGAYGCGFLADGTFIVMDLAGHQLFVAHTTHDNDLRRPTPLQIMAESDQPGRFRLYAGRSYVRFTRAKNT
jgi:hypothetical protein